MFNDGSTQQLTANRLALAMFDNVDSNGHKSKMLDSIVRHRATDAAVPLSDGYITSNKGRKTKKVTTKGWDFLIQWRDGF